MDKTELAMNAGQIFVPPAIETETAAEFGALFLAARYSHPDRPIKVYVNGYGGNTGQALAIADLITADGNVHGYLIGEVYSSHIPIWASCQKRFVGINASMYLHQVHYLPDRAGSSKDLLLHAAHTAHTDSHVAHLLALISKNTPDYWLDLMQSASGALSMLSNKEIVRLGMGEWM